MKTMVIGSRWFFTVFSLVALICLFGGSGCADDDSDGDGGSDSDTDGDTDTDSDTDSDTDTDSDSDADSGSDSGEECEEPTLPDNCEDVQNFECGFAATCVDGEVTANWHVHFLCESETDEQIIVGQCTYECPGGCDPTYDPASWTATGAALIAEACLDAPDGGTADGGI